MATSRSFGPRSWVQRHKLWGLEAGFFGTWMGIAILVGGFASCSVVSGLNDFELGGAAGSNGTGGAAATTSSTASSGGSGGSMSASSSGGAGSVSAGGGGGQGGGQGGGPSCDRMPSQTKTTINCDTADSCTGNALSCPPGLDCDVLCTGPSACRDAIIDCPSGYICYILCNSMQACQQATINCPADAVCQLECGMDSKSCDGADLNCGGLNCEAVCSGTSTPAVHCNNAPCMCTSCP